MMMGAQFLLSAKAPNLILDASVFKAAPIEDINGISACCSACIKSHLGLSASIASTTISGRQAVRKGTGRNSPLYYSKKEIKQALSMANIGWLLAKEEVSKLKLHDYE